MTRKLRRGKDYEIILDVKSDNFVAPPRAAQRNWLLNRALSEWARELEHMDVRARQFVAGRESAARGDLHHDELDDQTIMEDWQIPVMQAMAEAASATHGDVLEVGFGRGVSASFIQEAGVSSHTIVECNEHIVARYDSWRTGYGDRDIRLLQGRWQDLAAQFQTYDAIFFHAYPLTEEEFIDDVVRSTTFAESFFPHAAAHLRDGGIFTYLTNEVDSLSRAHQRLLLRHFRRFAMRKVGSLQVPEDTADTLWGDSMVVVEAMRSFS